MNTAWEANHMSLLQALQEATTTVTERVAPAVVRIGRGGGRGAGVVVADGLVATNAHNLRGSQVTITFADGRSETGEVADATARPLAPTPTRAGAVFYPPLPAGAELRASIDRLGRGESPARRRLGIALAPAPAARNLRRAVGLPERDGVLVRMVEENSPAAAGLRQGDLITSAGGRDLRSPDVTGGAYGSGSAAAVSPDGFLVTSAHVVAGSTGGVAAFGDGRELPFEIVGTDRLSDLAVIRATGGELHPARLGDADTLRVGQLVVAVGNPLGFAGSVSAGVVSALGRSFATSNRRHARIVETVIQTDASLHPGNSGGALATSAVEVVGINTAVVGPGIGQGLGLAVPVNATTTGIIAALMAERRVRRAYLGVRGGSRPLPPRAGQALAPQHPGPEHGREGTPVRSGRPAR